MSIETRVQRYGKVFKNWSINSEPIGEGSRSAETNDSTLVFKLSRRNLSFEEKSAMKVVNIVTKRGKYSELSDSEKRRYMEECNDKREKAERELQLMYKLRGIGNIVSYLDHDYDEWEEEYRYGCDLLIQMDLYDNLYKYVANGKRFSENEIIHIGIDICKALVECHKLGIIHRDIKPHNIFINNRGEYMLGDFGISKIVENQDYAVTSTGTKEYGAPEQFMLQGEENYDYRVDIYSLGLVLYQLANDNRLPFSSDTGYVDDMALRKRICGEKFPELVGVSKAVNQVIMKACAYDRENRYQTAEDFHLALNAVYNRKRTNNKESNYLVVENSYINYIDAYKTVPAGELYYENVAIKTSQNLLKCEEDSKSFQVFEKEDILNKVGYGINNISEAISLYKEKKYKKARKSFLKILWNIDLEKKEYYINGQRVNTGDIYLYLGNCCYYLKSTCGDNYKEAVQFYEKAVELNNDEAMYMLGKCYSDGYGVEKDFNKSHEMYKKSAELNNSKGQFEYGMTLYRGRVRKRGVEYIKKSADNNYIEAQRELCRMYYFGDDVEKDAKQVIRYGTKAMEQGDIVSQYYMALIYYEEGGEIERNVEKAEMLFLNVYLYGKDNLKKKVPGSSMSWCVLFENSGYYLIEIYFYSKCKIKMYGDRCSYCNNPDNLKKLIHYCQETIECTRLTGFGDSEREIMGNLYYYGIGVKKDYKTALYLLNGDLKKLFAPLGISHRKIYELRPESCYIVGEIYRCGKGGIKKNLAKAQLYLKQSYEKGYEPAREKLEYLNGDSI